MARSGWSTANYLSLAAAIRTGSPFSVSAWGKTSVTATQQDAFTLTNSGSDNEQYQLYVDTANKVNWAATSSGVGGTAVSTATIPTSTWFHMLGVETSATSRAVYLNGGSKGTNTTSKTPLSINRTGIGIFKAVSTLVPWAAGGTGSLAEVAVWSAALSDADAATLALGVSPFLVRPDALIAYWPLIGTYSPEINLLSNTNTMTITGTLSQAAHTRVFSAGGQRPFFAGVFVAPFVPAPYYYNFLAGAH